MKAGAAHNTPPPPQPSQQPVQQPIQHPNMQPLRQQREATAPQPQQYAQQANPYAQKGPDRQAVRTTGQVEHAPSASAEGANPNEDEEWLKPNIFKPGDLL